MSLRQVTDFVSSRKCFSTVFINGEFVSVKSGATFATVAPATEETLWNQCPQGGAEEINSAVAAARHAFDNTPWGTHTTGAERATLLRALAAQIEGSIEMLAKIESSDMGKNLGDATNDMRSCIGLLEENATLAEELDRLQDAPVEGNDANTGYIRQEPYGVVASITPWNYPLTCVIVKLAPALAAGNTIVIKPSEYTPLSAMFLAELVVAARIPPGVVNIVSGLGAEAGATLAHSRDIDMISFTGSIPTGSKIMAAAAANIKKPLLELGGKSAAVVFDDVNVDDVVPWLMQGFCQNAGQVCVCHTRAIVHESIKEKLVDRLAKEVKLIPFATEIAAPVPDLQFSHNPMGPIVSAAQYDRVMGFIDSAKNDPSCTLITGGGRPSGVDKGYFVEPTIFEVGPNSTIWKEEVFGPVLSLRTFRDESEAIKMANDTEYGLADGVFSSNVARAKRVANQLRAGILYVNQAMTGVAAPGGGYKMSGIGREGGMTGLKEYLQIKSVSVNTGANISPSYGRAYSQSAATVSAARL